MTTINLSLPNQIAKKIDAEAKNQGFTTRSAFILNLLSRRYAKQKLVEIKVFKKMPLDQIEDELKKTGKYNKKFITSVVKGLSNSSVYAR